MRILYVKEEVATLMSQWQNSYIINDLINAGIDIVKFSPTNYSSLDEANEALCGLLKNGTYDLFINNYNEKTIYHDTIVEIGKHGIPTVLICFDNLVAPHVHKNVCKYYDCVWLTSKENEASFKRWGASTIFLPYAASPLVCKPISKENINRIVFIGSPYGARVTLINGFVNSGIPIDIYYDSVNGNPFWQKQNTKNSIITAYEMSKSHIGRSLIYSAILQRLKNNKLDESDGVMARYYPSVPIEKQSEIYSNYTLSLSSTSARNTELLRNNIPIVNLRSFEIPMSGGVQFCRYNNELSNYFEEDKEIIFYRSDSEKVEKANYYLDISHIDIIRKIKMNARIRAVQEHTWMHRFNKLFDKLGITSTNDLEGYKHL